MVGPLEHGVAQVCANICHAAIRHSREIGTPTVSQARRNLILAYAFILHQNGTQQLSIPSHRTYESHRIRSGSFETDPGVYLYGISKNIIMGQSGSFLPVLGNPPPWNLVCQGNVSGSWTQAGSPILQDSPGCGTQRG
jgi:hypothetical protein